MEAQNRNSETKKKKGGRCYEHGSAAMNLHATVEDI
jgi:hypothetical protein